MSNTDNLNSKNKNQDIDRDFFYQYSQPVKKKNVDINKILNRVKLNKKIQTKKEITFYCSISLMLFLFGTLIAIVK